ncbi:other/FunK1 protein kinase [Coprinopsis cinerea AmutBmut pab1-1]|nr:other/FunK1 protein kinase [Coprinopsis cinerea AmutBmut pab1-1]
MFVRTLVDDEVTVVGILNDWDTASFLNGANQVPQSAAQNRTGTPPFMSDHLLYGQAPTTTSRFKRKATEPVRHSYQHDVESFFYILLWAAIHYRFDGTKDDTPSRVDNWASSNVEAVRRWKVEVMTRENYFLDEVLEPFVLPHFTELGQQWIVPMYDLIVTSRMKGSNVELTYEAVIEAIGEEA